MSQNNLFGRHFYVLCLILCFITHRPFFAAEISPVFHEKMTPVSAGQTTLETMMDDLSSQMRDFFWKSFKSKFVDEETKKILRTAYKNFVDDKKQFEGSTDRKTKELQLANMKNNVEKVKKIYIELLEKERLINKKKELIGKFESMKTETAKFIDQSNVDSIGKEEFKAEIDRFNATFFNYMLATRYEIPPAEFNKFIGLMEEEIRKLDHFREGLLVMKQAEERPSSSQAIQLSPEERESFDSLVKNLEQDIRKYINNVERPILTWHAEPWEQCVNAPLNLRLQLAAQIAFDVIKHFKGKEFLYITSFATGGFADSGAQLLQEFIILDAILRLWPVEKKLEIHLSLIGPDLDQLVYGKYNQVALLNREVDELTDKLIRESKKRHQIVLSTRSYKTHRDYIETVSKYPNLKPDALFSVDYSTFEPATEKSANSLNVSNNIIEANVDLLFVDLKPQEHMEDSLRIYYRPGIQISPESTKELIKTLWRQISIQDVNRWVHDMMLTPWVNRAPLLIELVIQQLKQFGYEFWDEKKPPLVLNRLIYMPLAFKEIIVNAIKPGQLIYSLQQKILMPADYKSLLLNPSFYIDPGITLAERERFTPLF